MTQEELLLRMLATPLCRWCPNIGGAYGPGACGNLFTPPVRDCERRRLLEEYEYDAVLKWRMNFTPTTEPWES